MEADPVDLVGADLVGDPATAGQVRQAPIAAEAASHKSIE
jgi:hypothetical protein